MFLQRSSSPVLKCRLPAGSSHVSDLHVEEGQEGVSTKGAGGVQVGVVCCPASHDLLVVHQAVARLTARTAGDQQLDTHTQRQVTLQTGSLNNIHLTTNPQLYSATLTTSVVLTSFLLMFI